MDWQSLRQRLSRDLLAGLAFFLPLALLAVVFYGLFVLALGVGHRVSDLFGLLGVRGTIQSAVAVLAALALTPILLAVTGTLLRHRYGERIGEAVDEAIVRIPGIGPVYDGLRQSRQVVLEDGGGFEDVVSLELAEGVDVLAFVVGREGGADWTSGDRRVTVYVPLSPNPTLGGHLLAVSPNRVSETTLSVRTGLTILATVGTSQPVGTEQPLADLYRELDEDKTDASGERLSERTG